MYCSPTWSGFCSASDRKRLESFLQCRKRLGYCSPTTPTVDQLFRRADESLFIRILTNEQHVLNALLDITRDITRAKRQHDREQIKKSNTSNERNFIIRYLNNNAYLFYFITFHSILFYYVMLYYIIFDSIRFYNV